MRERYAAVPEGTPRVLFGLSQSWEPVLHVIFHPSFVHSIAFSPDGGRLVSGSDEMVRIWNTATGELENELEGHTNWVWSVAFSHDGRFIVSGGDETVRIWNTATCDTRYILTGHTGEVTSVAISRNDQFVVSGSYDRTVRIWDTARGELLRELKGHAKGVMSVVVSPDCQHIASGSDKEVWIWTKDGIKEHKLECPEPHLYTLAFSHDGHRILCNANRTEWTITGHRLSPPDTDNNLDIASIAYSPDDSEIVCGLEDGTVMIWNTETNETYIPGRHTQVVMSVAFSRDGSLIASASNDETVIIWDPGLRGTFDEEVSELRSVALSYDGRWIVTASPLGHIQVWRVTKTVTKANKLILENRLSSLALSWDGSRVASGCRNGSIQVWNHSTNTIECQIRSGHSDIVSCVALSYNGSHVVSGSWDNTVRIWDCHTGNEVGLHQNLDRVTCVAFSRDSGRVAFGDDARTVWIWNPSTSEICNDPDNMSEGHGWVYSVGFSHDDSHVISGRDDEVWIWNVMTNKSTKLSERIQLPDGTRVHPLGKIRFHIYDPVNQETTNGIPSYLLSISQDHAWIIGEQGEHICWIPPQYRNFNNAHIAESIVCLQSRYGMIVLDMKSTQRAERVTP